MVVDSFKTIDTEDKKNKSGVSYHIRGYSFALLGWIYEAVPAIGTKVELRSTEKKLPRMLRYKFIRDVEIPPAEDIKLNIRQLLKPSNAEKQTPYWLSLQKDLEIGTFAFKYDPNDAKKKRKREAADNGEDNEQPHANEAEAANKDDQDNLPPPPPRTNIASTSTAPPAADTRSSVLANLIQGPERAVLVREIAEAAANMLISWLSDERQQLVEDVRNYVVNKLQEQGVVQPFTGAHYTSPASPTINDIQPETIEATAVDGDTRSEEKEETEAAAMKSDKTMKEAEGGAPTEQAGGRTTEQLDDEEIKDAS